MTDWNFADSVPKDRVKALSVPSTIERIAERVAGEMEVVCCHFQVCDLDHSFGRVAYCIRVSRDAFDQFFNSPYGYRGAYFRSPGEGLDANAVFVRTIAPKLLAHSQVGASDYEVALVRESLTSPSAKAWLAENGLGVCASCDGEWGNPTDSTPDIINGRWELSDTAPAHRGRKAPRLTKIRVFGAFLDELHNELVPARKRHRASEINSWGWS
jgi:hypothetical protein